MSLSAIRHFVLATLLLSVAAPLSAQATTYDLGADWSDSQNPRSVWSCKAGLNPITNHVADWASGSFLGAQPAWAAAASGSGHIPTWFKQQSPWTGALNYDTQVGDVVMHANDPASGTDTDLANVTWTCPATANAQVTGAVWMIRNLGRTMNWTLSLNKSLIAQGSLPGAFNRSNPATFSATRSVVPGDVIKLEFARTSPLGDLAGVILTIKLDQPSGNYQIYGAGCGPTIGNTGLPLLNKIFSVELFNARPTSPALLLIGVRSAALDLSGIGMPGCTLLASTEIILALQTNASGQASVGLAVPNDQALLGAPFFNQFVVLSPGANPLGVLASDGGLGTAGR